MKLVLWPNHLLGGLLQREGGVGGAERGEGGPGGFAEGIRGIAGRLQDADTILTGSMSEELRDWDLWYARLCLIISSLTHNSTGVHLSFHCC